MRGRLRSAWLDVKASYWFLPALFTILAFATALATVEIDRAGTVAWINDEGWLHPSRPEGARSQLSVIASSMIAVASTVFAITIAAVAYASGNYGPRLLNNFMNDRGNQVSLATFIATFVYSLMVLRVVRGENEATTLAEGGAAAALPGFVPQLSLLVAMILFSIAIGVLVFFLHHVPASIRVNSVLAGIGRRLIDQIEERYPEQGTADWPARSAAGQSVAADRAGYIEMIDFGALDAAARRADIVVTLAHRTGDFVHHGMPLLTVEGAVVDGDCMDSLRAAFMLGDSRTADQDLEYQFDELVEIGLRALSPGINDPFTAVTSLHWIGAATACISLRDLASPKELEDCDSRRVVPLADTFDHFLARGFGSIRPSVAASPIALKVALDCLANVGRGPIGWERRAAILEEIRRLIAQAERALDGPALAEARAAFDRAEADLLAIGSGGTRG